VTITLTAGDGYAFEISDGVYDSTIVINRTLTVTEREITVTIDSASKGYDENIITVDGIGYTVTSGSVVGGDDL
jgi:DNA-binding winged helix-turn-helix (wHTH) protein